jgi:hypothetical protein
MEFGSVFEKIIFAAVIIAFLILFSLFRAKNPQRERADIVGNLLEETNLNIILADTFDQQPQQWSFHVTQWQLRRKKLEFLDSDLRKDLDASFGIASDFNQRLRAARKAKSLKRETVDLTSLRETLPKVKQGLEDWLLANYGTLDHYSKPPGITDWLFGRK